MLPSQSQATNLTTGSEPRLQDLLDDPTLHLLMDRDGVGMDELTDLIALTRKRLLARRWRHVA